MTEYIIIVVLIAIATISVITLFGDNIRGLFGPSANALAGSTAEQNRNLRSGGLREEKRMSNAFQTGTRRTD